MIANKIYPSNNEETISAEYRSRIHTTIILSGNTSCTPPNTSSSNNIHHQIIGIVRDIIRSGNSSH